MAQVEPSALRAGAREVAATLRAAGFEAYYAGGCVRDVLRGETPKDWDVVTNARPPEVTKLFRRTVHVGAAFGVVRVLISGHREYEVATYREDGGYTDGRHPDAIRYSSSKEEDVQRRDFTINALLMDPETSEVLDFVGGRADLDKGLIRAVGVPDARFGEDRLRMLRAIRFAARFGYAIEPETLAAIHRHAKAIDAVSIERIVAELEGIFDARDPAHGFDLLASTGLFQAVLPKIDVDDLTVRATLRERLARLPLELEKGARAEVAWAALWDLAKTDDLEADLRALKLSKKALRDIQRLLEKKPILVAPERARTFERMRLLVDSAAPDYGGFTRVLLGAEHPAIAHWQAEVASLRERPLPPLPLVGGGDLQALGFRPGPQFKEILEAVELEVLERRITTKDEALAFVRARWPSP